MGTVDTIMEMGPDGTLAPTGGWQVLMNTDRTWDFCVSAGQRLASEAMTHGFDIRNAEERLALLRIFFAATIPPLSNDCEYAIAAGSRQAARGDQYQGENE